MKKFAGYWQQGLPKLDTITWRPVVDNNTRAAMLQTGEAQFAFPIPYEQAAILQKNSKLELVASPSIMQRYISMNVTQKPFDNPKVREAINYAINRQALVKVAFAGFATPATGVLPPAIAYAQSYQPWPYDPAKARELLKRRASRTALAPRYGHPIITVPRRRCCSLPSSSWRRSVLRCRSPRWMPGSVQQKWKERAERERRADVLHRLVGLYR